MIDWIFKLKYFCPKLCAWCFHCILSCLRLVLFVWCVFVVFVGVSPLLLIASRSITDVWWELKWREREMKSFKSFKRSTTKLCFQIWLCIKLTSFSSAHPGWYRFVLCLNKWKSINVVYGLLFSSSKFLPNPFNRKFSVLLEKFSFSSSSSLLLER